MAITEKRTKSTEKSLKLIGFSIVYTKESTDEQSGHGKMETGHGKIRTKLCDLLLLRHF